MLKDKKINFDIPLPLYYQIEQFLKEAIESGEYDPGDNIPTEQELVELFDVSRNTVRQAIMNLVHEGILYRVKSQGTFVADKRIEQDFIQRLTSFNEEMEQQGCKPSSKVLTLARTAMPEEMQKLRGDKRKKAILLERLRFADKRPVVHVKTYLPADECDFVLGHDFAMESLYGILGRSKATKIYKVTRICRADIASAEDMKLLGVKKGAPIHHFESIGYNEAGDVIEYSIARYRGDRNEFKVDVYPMD